MLTKIQSDPSSVGYGTFYKNGLRTYIIRVYVAKKLEHCHFVQNFTPADEMISKIQSNPSPFGYGILIFKWS